MIATTPSGTRTRSIVMPFGRFQLSVTVPTGSAAGNYELTVVVEDARATPSTQWSEDPEFDTTGG